MMFITTPKIGARIECCNTKRWLRIVSVLSPSLPGLAALAHLVSGNAWWAPAPVSFYQGVVVAADQLIAVGPNNPPEEVVDEMAADGCCRVLLFISAPVFGFSFPACAITARQPGAPVCAWFGLALSAGVSCGAVDHRWA